MFKLAVAFVAFAAFQSAFSSPVTVPQEASELSVLDVTPSDTATGATQMLQEAGDYYKIGSRGMASGDSDSELDSSSGDPQALGSGDLGGLPIVGSGGEGLTSDLTGVLPLGPVLGGDGGLPGGLTGGLPGLGSASGGAGGLLGGIRVVGPILGGFVQRSVVFGDTKSVH